MTQHHVRRLSNGKPTPLVDRASSYVSPDVDELSEAARGIDREWLRAEVERLKNDPPYSDDNL